MGDVGLDVDGVDVDDVLVDVDDDADVDVVDAAPVCALCAVVARLDVVVVVANICGTATTVVRCGE